MDQSLLLAKSKLPPRPLTAPATSFRIDNDDSSDDENFVDAEDDDSEDDSDEDDEDSDDVNHNGLIDDRAKKTAYFATINQSLDRSLDNQRLL